VPFAPIVAFVLFVAILVFLLTMLDDLTKQRLLQIAAAAAEAQVLGRRPLTVPPDIVFPTSGVFVSLHYGRMLRGCLGTLGDREPLALAVARIAAAVCHEDPRFAPVHHEELRLLTIEISVLTPRQPVSDIIEIEVGRHGLIVEQGRHRGLLLPQVAVEHGWDREEFLVHTCLKADLPRDAWRNRAQIYRFEADVFAQEPGAQGARGAEGAQGAPGARWAL
jgi:uncharacterized protein